MGQGQPRVIIWTTLVVLPYKMLHTKFQGHWSIGSGEEDFLRFLPYMGMAAMLVMWPKPFEYLFFPKGPGDCIWNLVAIGPVVSEEESFEIVDGRTTDGRRTTEPAYTISSPGAFGSGELKRVWKQKDLTVCRYQHWRNAVKILALTLDKWSPEVKWDIFSSVNGILLHKIFIITLPSSWYD